MMKPLGIGADLNKFATMTWLFATKQVKLYKEIREIVQDGFQYPST